MIGISDSQLSRLSAKAGPSRSKATGHRKDRIFTGITAHRRADGEYPIFVEDDGRGKVLVYR